MPARSARTATVAALAFLPRKILRGATRRGRCDGGTPAGAGNRRFSDGSLPERLPVAERLRCLESLRRPPAQRDPVLARRLHPHGRDGPHVAALSISSHVASRTSPDRAAVSTGQTKSADVRRDRRTVRVHACVSQVELAGWRAKAPAVGVPLSDLLRRALARTRTWTARSRAGRTRTRRPSR